MMRPLTAAPAATQLPAVTTDRWTGTATRFVRDLEQGAHADAAAAVSPSVPAGAMSAERLGQIWTQLTDRLGTLTTLAPRGVTEQDGRRIVDLAAHFARSEVILRVVLDGDARVAGFWVSASQLLPYETPAYVDTTRFREVELTVGAEPALGATLSLPSAGADAPVVVLVHGSGPSDRDETLGPNRPFRDLAWGLASQGVAVLRYDKRTYAHPRTLGADVTVEREVVLDALAALAAARAADGVDSARVFLLGHSLGGTLAPEIALRDGSVAGVILLAASARPLAEVLLEQLAYVDSVGTATGQGGEELQGVAPLASQLATRTLAPETQVLGAPASYFYDLTDRRPLERARELRGPMLVLQGGRDYQVTDADFALWREALAGRPGVELRAYPALNHLFMPGEGKATPAEYARPGHVAAELVADIARWLHAQR